MNYSLNRLLCLALLFSFSATDAALADKSQWDKYMDAAAVTFKEGHLSEAEKSLSLAVQEAEKSGPENSRLALSLNNLASVYFLQQKYTQAEPLFKRALAINEKILGPNAPNVASCLENYAELLDKTNRQDEAAKLQARARSIRAKQKQN